VSEAVGAPLAAPPAVASGTGSQTNQAPAGAHAGPSVRRMARELGIDLSGITASGPKGRITKDDLLGFLKGPVQTQPLGWIKKVSGPFLHRSWLNVPHVTHHDEADIAELDAYRKRLDTAAKADRNPYRVTLLAFLVKAVVAALKQHPEFNSSLTAEKDAIVVKGYYHIGIAVDTSGGLVVPVVRDADRKGIVELSREFMAISAKARDGKLGPNDMQGGTFTISSLGGIGGTSFTRSLTPPRSRSGVVRSSMRSLRICSVQEAYASPRPRRVRLASGSRARIGSASDDRGGSRGGGELRRRLGRAQRGRAADGARTRVDG
jgi:pyruvate dehydrogenase E2 component (dihydrolipoamide acetyltransferase)